MNNEYVQVPAFEPMNYLHRRVRVYYNLTRRCWSITDAATRRVIGHWWGRLTLTACAFVVSQAGRARVLREKRKNVHAVIEGCIGDGSPPLIYQGGTAEWLPVGYNPYRNSTFIVRRTDGSEEPVMSASQVKLGATFGGNAREVLAWVEQPASRREVL